MKLTSKVVNDIIRDCFFTDDEAELIDRDDLPEDAVTAEGLVMKVAFKRDRLESHRQEIIELLSQLPEAFHEKTGGGWSFLNACNTVEGVQWGEHRNVEELLLLGLAIGKVEYLFQRQNWDILPGGAPYFVVKL